MTVFITISVTHAKIVKLGKKEKELKPFCFQLLRFCRDYCTLLPFKIFLYDWSFIRLKINPKSL